MALALKAHTSDVILLVSSKRKWLSIVVPQCQDVCFCLYYNSMQHKISIPQRGEDRPTYVPYDDNNDEEKSYNQLY